MTLSIDSTELIYLVLGPGALLLGALLLRVDLRLRARCQEVADRLATVELDLQRLRQLAENDPRQRELEDRIVALTQQYEQLLLRDAETGPYFRAVRLAENGADAASLIEQTGVTPAEAQLILSLHGRFAAEAKADERDEAPGPAI